MSGLCSDKCFSASLKSRSSYLGFYLLVVLVNSESLSEWTQEHGLDVEERYITYSQNYMRLTNNLFQVKNVLAVGVRTNRSVLLLDLANRPPDHLLDFKAMQHYMAPRKIYYLPALLSSRWNATWDSIGLSMVHEPIARLAANRCLTFNGHTNLGGSKLWHFQNPPIDLGHWSALEHFLKHDRSEQVEVLCDRASLWSVAENIAPVPIAARLRDESRRILAELRATTEKGLGTALSPAMRENQLRLIPKISETKVLSSSAGGVQLSGL